ncbi:hypothetical protein PHAVU_004G126700 [Phaseolus vulgaris]|uniref:Transmembrane protein n=1 Tax=Phaseolus vulgaris TaxID=3885 RepID=V7C2K4_PHAVU|nr:hypothetical protein PHAVU_004G126700g [Phaseolus vulgaris]ESW24392.1 hypothetical protein PHAVU_004G126700g [Phaseolus vulgaris]
MGHQEEKNYLGKTFPAAYKVHAAVSFLHLCFILVRCGTSCWFSFRFSFIYVHLLFISSSVCGFFRISLLPCSPRSNRSHKSRLVSAFASRCHFYLFRL